MQDTVELNSVNFYKIADYYFTFVLQHMLELGADSNQRNFKNETPLHLAAKIGSTGTLQILLRNEGDVNRRTK
jgi:ankyrin repeat protein